MNQLSGLFGAMHNQALHKGFSVVQHDIREHGVSSSPDHKRTALRQAAEEFEAIFLAQMLAAMRKTVGDGGLVDRSNGEKIFTSMLDDEWARKLASTTTSGSISDLLYRQLSQKMGLESAVVAAEALDASPPGGTSAEVRRGDDGTTGRESR